MSDKLDQNTVDKLLAIIEEQNKGGQYHRRYEDISHSRQEDKDSMVAIVVKAVMGLLMTLTTAGVLWLMSSVSTLNTTVAVMQTEQQSQAETIKELRQFAKEERFTGKDFENKFQPAYDYLKTEITRNTTLLNERGEFIDKTEKRLNLLEVNYSRILQSLENVEKSIEKIADRK